MLAHLGSGQPLMARISKFIAVPQELPTYPLGDLSLG
jgi:hypothetical protein